MLPGVIHQNCLGSPIKKNGKYSEKKSKDNCNHGRDGIIHLPHHDQGDKNDTPCNRCPGIKLTWLENQGLFPDEYVADEPCSNGIEYTNQYSGQRHQVSAHCSMGPHNTINAQPKSIHNNCRSSHFTEWAIKDH